MAAPAIQDPSAYVNHPAEVVGNAFARQYYTILQQSPALVFRFYQDISRLGRTGDNGVMGSITTMDAINERIQSYGSLKADIKFVDAQESYNGGVIVLVTGSMVNADDSRRGFTQTFFLAPQDKGYFVLNDIFRYVEDDFQENENQLDEIQDGGIAPTAPSQDEAPPVQEIQLTDDSNGEVYNPHENGEVPVVEEEEVGEEEPVAEVVDEAPTAPQVVVESKVKVEEIPNDSHAPKKSYASIVMKDTHVAPPSPNLPKSMPKVQEQQWHVTAAPMTMAPPSSADMLEDENNHHTEGDGHSIYIKNLPSNASVTMVEEAFKRFGTIKSNGIQIRHQKSFCFGFVEFDLAGAVQSAIEASPITIGGRDVVVEEKKSPSLRGPGRGRYPSGRGGGFNKGGEGGRGRGSYGGGRGYGRGDRNDFGNRGGGRGYYNRSEVFQRNDQNGGGRGNRGGGSGVGNPRSQRVPAQG